MADAQGPHPPASDGLPARWGPYELLAVLGTGGNGVVYRARPLEGGAEVAVKTLQFSAPPTDEAMQRLQREAKTGSTLARHPGIVPVVGSGYVGTVPYLAMLLVRGASLREALTAGRFPGREERVRLLVEVARAVAHAHDHRIVHRDLKPSNILIGEDGHPLVTDFGLAKKLDQSAPLTAPGQVVGTILYMPPEQIEGELDEIGPPCDVYALGVVLYELLVGRPPFMGATFAAIAAQVLAGTPPPLRRLDPTVPPDLEAVCLRALARDPRQRHPTAKELAEDLERHLAGAPPARATAKPWWRRIF